MGFWPYFLQAQESNGGGPSPFVRDPSVSAMGIDTTRFCTERLLQKGQKRKKTGDRKSTTSTLLEGN